MTPRQFHYFKSIHSIKSLWSYTDEMNVSGSFQANSSGVFFLVVDNKSGKQVSVKQSATITTTVFNVSNATALESCGSDCVLEGFQSNETVIVEYTGPELFVGATVSYGKRILPRSELIAFVVFAVITGASLVTSIWCVIIIERRNGECCNGHSEPPPRSVPVETSTTAGKEVETPQENEKTPEHDLQKPLIDSTSEDPVYFGGDLPPEYSS